MANKEHVELIKMGTGVWNAWRQENPSTRPDLSLTNLRGVILKDANLKRTNLIGADLSGADLTRASLNVAYLVGANLNQADLIWANLPMADLTSANLTGANLTGANFNWANLQGADFSKARLVFTAFANNDLSVAKGLETVAHEGPSSIDFYTLVMSDGKLPEVFLRGVGLPEAFIAQIPLLIAQIEPIQFHSCFISYSHQDQDFSERLYSRMRQEKLRVWYAPDAVKGGEKLHEQISRAIKVYDRLLIVLSENSMKSEWVMTEIRGARKVEREENRRKLFPIRLVDFETIKSWECFDADSGKDLAVELREYYIPDFSNWEGHGSFEEEFAKLLRDLKATES